MTDEVPRTKAKRLLDELVGLAMTIGSGDTSKETADAVSRLKRDILALKLGQDWRSIETAPKDGTPILLYCPYDPQRGIYNDQEWPLLIGEWDFGKWRVHGNDIAGDMVGIDPKPTHWMPSPINPHP